MNILHQPGMQFKHKVTGETLTLKKKHSTIYELSGKGGSVFCCPSALEEVPKEIEPCVSREPYV